VKQHGSSDFTLVDLFSGCGGMSLGFQRAGFRILAAFDNWKPAVDVYRANFDHPIHQVDLGVQSARDLVKGLKPHVIAGGPPCQDFSSAGPGEVGSRRAGLSQAFAQIIKAASPQYFVLENVPRIRISPKYPSIVSGFRRLGYGLTEKVLDACFCGVPQRRTRLFVIGGLGLEDGFLDALLEIRLASKPLTLRRYLGPTLNTDYYFRVPTNYKRRGVFSVDEPCATIRAVDRPIPIGYPGHPEDPVPIGPRVRALTVLERSYVQTFPRSFVFRGTQTDLNTMIGNAVPVKMAQFVASALHEFMAGKDEKSGSRRTAV